MEYNDVKEFANNVQFLYLSRLFYYNIFTTLNSSFVSIEAERRSLWRSVFNKNVIMLPNWTHNDWMLILLFRVCLWSILPLDPHPLSVWRLKSWVRVGQLSATRGRIQKDSGISHPGLVINNFANNTDDNTTELPFGLDEMMSWWLRFRCGLWNDDNWMNGKDSVPRQSLRLYNADNGSGQARHNVSILIVQSIYATELPPMARNDHGNWTSEQRDVK